LLFHFPKRNSSAILLLISLSYLPLDGSFALQLLTLLPSISPITSARVFEFFQTGIKQIKTNKRSGKSGTEMVAEHNHFSFFFLARRQPDRWIGT
jgi:hypothetical protein